MSFFKKLITRLARKKLGKLDELHQKHEGEECYIFGDGISLKWMDMKQFGDKPSILGGFMVYHNEVNELNVPYCALIEPYYFWPISPYRGSGKLQFYRNKLNIEYIKFIKKNPSIIFFVNISNYFFTKFLNVLFVTRVHSPAFDLHNLFKERMDSHDGTLKFQIALAVYLGFSKAYLVGHDYTHKPARNLHFYEKGEGVFGDQTDFCKDYLDYSKQYIDLVTVTLDTGSDTLNAITYENLTSEKPRYRENTELVSKDKLDNLASWNGYNIF